MPRNKFGKTVKTADQKGIAHKADGMKSEGQGGSGKTTPVGKPSVDKGKAGAGKTAKEPSYSRKRH
jgi:hypothetical protein